MAQLLQRFGGRLDAEDDLGRIARDHPEDDKNHSRDQKKSGNENEDAFAEKSEHGI